MSKSKFVILPALTAIAVAYKQANLVADLVLPRTPVMGKEFTWQKYALGEQFTVPDTRVGAKGQPNQVDWASTPVTDSVVDHALDSPVTNDQIEQWQKARDAGNSRVVDPLMRATSLVSGLVATRREKRAADLVFNAANYGANNKQTLSGASQWSDPASDPHYALMTAMDSMVMRPNAAVMGRAVFTVLSLNAKIKTAVYGGVNGNQQAVSRQALAQLLELDEIIVGEGWLNTAAPGQAPNLARIWGKHCSLFNRNVDAGVDAGLSFGMTAEFGAPVAGTIEDSDIGMRGGQRVRMGESVKEFLTANDLGYLFTNAVN